MSLRQWSSRSEDRSATQARRTEATQRLSVQRNHCSLIQARDDRYTVLHACTLGSVSTWVKAGRLSDAADPTRDPRTTLMVPVIEPSLDRAIDALRKAVATRPQRTAVDP
jgi:hypothetical protein